MKVFRNLSLPHEMRGRSHWTNDQLWGPNLINGFCLQKGRVWNTFSFCRNPFSSFSSLHLRDFDPNWGSCLSWTVVQKLCCQGYYSYSRSQGLLTRDFILGWVKLYSRFNSLCFSHKRLKMISIYISVFYWFRSVKTFTYESLNHIVRLINGISALLLAILPGKTSILEGIHGWELRPTFRGPKFPRWMEK